MEHCTTSNFNTGDHHHYYYHQQSSSSWLSLRTIACILGLLIHVVVLPAVESTECVKRKYTVGFFAVQRNATLKCTMSFQWTVSDFCCYDRYDRNEDWPYCCYSEAYKLALAVGFICLVLLGSSFCLFCCWFYNLPHHLLYIISCRKFRLDDWLEKSRNGPYVDPSFYAGEPFWAGGDVQPYPLRPMPPRIFYPAPPPNMKFRWEMGQGDMPLFILASRQFHRNPYSARPNNNNDRIAASSSTVSTHHHTSHGVTSNPSTQQPLMFSDSRRSSVTTLNGDHNREGTAKSSSHGGRRSSSSTGASAPPPFRINIDEATAKSELIEAVRIIEEKSDDVELEESVREGSGNTNNNNSKRDSLSSSRPSSNTNMDQSTCKSTGDELNYNSCRGDLDSGGPHCSSLSSSYNCQHQGNSRGGKVSVEALNQQLSSSLGLSIANLPNVHVIGNFGSGMETIEEDDGGFDETEMDYYPTPPFTPPLGHTTSRSGAGGAATVPPSRAPSAVIDEDSYRRFPNTKKSNNNSNSNGTNRSSTAQSERIPRISSALDRIVTRARAEVPFRPSLPGSIPENSAIDPFISSDSDDSPEEIMRRRLSHMQFDENEQARFEAQRGLARRNSAPVNF